MVSSQLKTRILSAVLLIPPVIAIVYVGGGLFAALLGVAIGISLAEWFALARKTTFPRYIKLIGCVYLTVSFSSFFLLRDMPEVGFAMAIFVYVSVWASDSVAYLFGKVIGGPKLAPQISPNKTYAGLVGAMVGCALALIAFHALFDIFEIPNIKASYVLLAGIGAVLGVVAQIGDLLISRLKRAAGEKDSGALIPGHGGLLDRIDSMLLVAPVFYVLVSEFIP